MIQTHQSTAKGLTNGKEAPIQPKEKILTLDLNSLGPWGWDFLQPLIGNPYFTGIF